MAAVLLLFLLAPQLASRDDELPQRELPPHFATTVGWLFFYPASVAKLAEKATFARKVKVEKTP